MFGHPSGLFYLFFVELWERFSFYGMRALLTLYMVSEIFEALKEKDTATAIVYASYGSLVYASTVIGGRISDKILGMRSSIFLGGVLMSLGHFVLAIENDIAFFLALAFIIHGLASFFFTMSGCLILYLSPLSYHFDFNKILIIKNRVYDIFTNSRSGARDINANS